MTPSSRKSVRPDPPMFSPRITEAPEAKTRLLMEPKEAESQLIRRVSFTSPELQTRYLDYLSPTLFKMLSAEALGTMRLSARSRRKHLELFIPPAAAAAGFLSPLMNPQPHCDSDARA